MYELRDHSLVTDRRLDRLVQFDERSRRFPISATAEQKPLQSNLWGCDTWLDQGQEGACVAFSLGHELAAMPEVVTGITPTWLVQSVYWEAQRTDEWEGGSYPGASPVYEGTSVLCGVKALQKMGFFESYRWGFSTEDVIRGIGYDGPAVLGVNWYGDMYTPDQDGFIHMTGQIAGGHAILARGVDVENKFVTLRNSWGRDWGRDGDCYISFSDFDKLLQDNGEACFLINRIARAV